MAEAEDVITDAARHATVFVRDLWRRHRPPDRRERVRVADVAPRLDLLLTALFGRGWTLRAADPPARPTLLQRLYRRQLPHQLQAIPATDGRTLWIPDAPVTEAPPQAVRRMRVQALQQAMRALRGAPQAAHQAEHGLGRALLQVIEAHSADADLVRLLPGWAGDVAGVRAWALALRPPPAAFSEAARPLELLVRETLRLPADAPDAPLRRTRDADESLRHAHELAHALCREHGQGLLRADLFRDHWLGALKPPAAALHGTALDAAVDATDRPAAARSARLTRAPQVREAAEDEDDAEPGAWMVQTAQPNEHAEDPIGMQRPTDRDETTAAEDFADSLSELPEARLVSAPGRPKEYLLSETPPAARTHQAQDTRAEAGDAIVYPEWDYRINAYGERGAVVREQPAPLGDAQWVARTLEAHAGMLGEIRRRFEMLRAQRVRLHRQLDGEDIDLDAWIDSHADFRAGLPRSQRLYRTLRAERRDLAVALLIDVSGSTDAWVNAQRRIIDVEREALLLVCIALDSLASPYAIHAFSGEGPDAVWVRRIKDFTEAHGAQTGLRIAALEPERYTRAGAAIRHVSAGLMRQPARQRLLLLLSDGRPNDQDEYDGRYGVEDMRQAVTEAKLQGIFPFCLTVDRQAPSYLPQVFGASQYALLPRPEALPAVLLDWLRRLVSS